MGYFPFLPSLAFALRRTIAACSGDNVPALTPWVARAFALAA
jgi:hypothetical protein